MLLQSAEVQKLLRWLSIKGDIITSKKDKNWLSSTFDTKYRSRSYHDAAKTLSISENCMLNLIWVRGGGNFTPPVAFPLITQKR